MKQGDRITAIQKGHWVRQGILMLSNILIAYQEVIKLLYMDAVIS